jgi:hypothetical protein
MSVTKVGVVVTVIWKKYTSWAGPKYKFSHNMFFGSFTQYKFWPSSRFHHGYLRLIDHVDVIIDHFVSLNFECNNRYE